MIFICTLPQHCRHRIFTKFVEQLKNPQSGVPIVAPWVTNLTGVHEDAGLIPDLTQWVKDLVFP